MAEIGGVISMSRVACLTRDSGRLRARPMPGEEAPREGWGPIGLCPWGGAPKGNIRTAGFARRERVEGMALPVQK